MKVLLKKNGKETIKVKIRIGNKTYRLTQTYPERLLVSKEVNGKSSAMAIMPSCGNEFFIE